MIKYRKILELYLQGVTQRTIAASTGHSRDKIREVVNRANTHRLSELTPEMTNGWLSHYLFPEHHVEETSYLQPDWEYIHKELMKKNVTLRLLHREYESEARRSHRLPYAYRTFCHKYGTYGKRYKLTMPIHRKPGELIETDWAGSTLMVKNPETGEEIKVYIFVATLPYSQYNYVEAFFDMKTASWLSGHIHAFEFFGGVTETVVPDNLRTGVTKSDYSEPLLNEAYRQLADYYRFTVVPARIRSPKDKPSVEGNVGFISRQIIASLRKAQFMSLEELNQAILEKVIQLNQEPFQNKPGSRETVFEEEEKAFLLPLRHSRFQLSEWRFATVNLNYHIQVHRMYYSVPYEFVKNEVEVRITDDLIEVYFNDRRIASHKRIHGDVGQFSTNLDHMPDHHRKYLSHTPQENREWAQRIGPSTAAFVERLLSQHVEKKALRHLASLRNTAKDFDNEAMENACQILLMIAKQPTNKMLRTILLRNKKQADGQKLVHDLTNQTDGNYGFVRGKDYFGGN